MEKITAEMVCSRWDKLKAEKANTENYWQEVADFTMPLKNSITKSQETGARRNDDIVNDRAIQDNDKLAAGLFGFLCPPKEQWFQFSTTDEQLEKESEAVNLYFSEVSRIILKKIYSSNFTLQMNESFLDLGAFGTCCIFIEKGTKKFIRFKSIPVQSFVMAEDADGDIDTVYQLMKLTPRQMVQRFGYENLSKETKKKIDKNKDMDSKIEIIHAVQPRTDFTKGKITADNDPVMSVYVEREAKHIIEEGGYPEMPYIAGRFTKSNDEVYGRGPGMTCLPRTKMVNRMGYTVLRAGEKRVDPPYAFPDEGIVSDVSLNAGDIVFIQSTYYENQPHPLVIPAEIGIGIDLMQREEDAIDKAFYTDLFERLPEMHNMTTTEVSERISEKLLLFIPMMARVQSEVLTPTLERVFAICDREGILPDPPQELMENPDYEIKYVGKMALALKSLDVAAVQEVLNLLLPFAEIKPEVMENINWDKLSRGIAIRKGVPGEFIHTEKEMMQMQQAKQQQMQQQQMMQALPTMADAVSKTSKDVEPNSPMNQIMQGISGQQQ